MLRFYRTFKSMPLYKIVPFHLADIGEGIKECEILQWYKQKGDSIEEFEKLCEVQSDKAAVEITSRYTGKITTIHKKAGEIVQVGGVLVDIDTNDTNDSGDTAPAAVTPSTPPSSTQVTSTTPVTPPKHTPAIDSKVLTTPSVRRIAREHKIDLNAVVPTGKNKRIMKVDVENFINSGSTSTITKSTPSSSVYTQNSIEKAMFKSMTLSQSIPRFGYTDMLDTYTLEVLRKNINSSLKTQNIKLSSMPFIIKAFGVACLEYPTLNCTVLNDKIMKNNNVTIGIAMDTPNGLMVPNIKNVQDKSILEIHNEMQTLLEKAKLNKLNMSDISGTTFTVSNIGTIGGIWVHPVVPFGTTTIIGLGKSQFVQNPDNPTPDIIKVMPLSLSADHRIVDGATSARFIQFVKSLLNGTLMTWLK